MSRKEAFQGRLIPTALESMTNRKYPAINGFLFVQFFTFIVSRRKCAFLITSAHIMLNVNNSSRHTTIQDTIRVQEQT